MEKKKVALVLSMGGARGVAHIGVIEELVAQGYEIASIAGSSMGALVGALYATGRIEAGKEWICSWSKHKMWQLADISFSRYGLVKGERFVHELKDILPETSIEDLPIPFVAMATDIAHDCEVRLDQGSLTDAIRASISIPLLFRPFAKDNCLLVDGGILNPLPLKHVARTAGDRLVAVDVNAPIAGKNKRYSPYQLITKSSRLMMQQITKYQLEQYQPDLLIQLSGNSFDMMEFHHADAIIECGRLAARAALARYNSSERMPNACANE